MENVPFCAKQLCADTEPLDTDNYMFTTWFDRLWKRWKSTIASEKRLVQLHQSTPEINQRVFFVYVSIFHASVKGVDYATYFAKHHDSFKSPELLHLPDFISYYTTLKKAVSPSSGPCALSAVDKWRSCTKKFFAPRVNITRLASYQALPVLSHSVHTPGNKSVAQTQIDEFGTRTGFVQAAKLLSDVLVRLQAKEFLYFVIQAYALFIHYTQLHNNVRQMQLAVKAMKAQLAQQKRGESALLFFEIADEEIIQTILDYTTVPTIAALCCVNSRMAANGALQKALPCMRWNPNPSVRTVWTENDAAVLCYKSPIEVCLEFGARSKAGVAFKLLSISTFCSAPPEIQVKLVFDSPGMEIVSGDHTGAAVRPTHTHWSESGVPLLKMPTFTWAEGMRYKYASVQLMAVSSDYKNAFDKQTAYCIDAIKGLPTKTTSDNERLRELKAMQHRNKLRQHFRLRCDVVCKLKFGGTKTFRCMSPPFVLFNRKSAKKRKREHFDADKKRPHGS